MVDTQKEEDGDKSVSKETKSVTSSGKKGNDMYGLSLSGTAAAFSLGGNITFTWLTDGDFDAFYVSLNWASTLFIDASIESQALYVENLTNNALIVDDYKGSGGSYSASAFILGFSRGGDSNTDYPSDFPYKYRSTGVGVAIGPPSGTLTQGQTKMLIKFPSPPPTDWLQRRRPLF